MQIEREEGKKQTLDLYSHKPRKTWSHFLKVDQDLNVKYLSSPFTIIRKNSISNDVVLKTAGEAPQLPAPKLIYVNLLSLFLPVSWLAAEHEVILFMPEVLTSCSIRDPVDFCHPQKCSLVFVVLGHVQKQILKTSVS